MVAKYVGSKEDNVYLPQLLVKWLTRIPNTGKEVNIVTQGVLVLETWQSRNMISSRAANQLILLWAGKMIVICCCS